MVQDGPRWLKLFNLVWNGQMVSNGPGRFDGQRKTEMVQNGLKWSKRSNMAKDTIRFQDGPKCLKHRKQYILHTYGFSFVLLFSLCSNLSKWPGRQVVPNGSQCYIPISDGLVFHQQCHWIEWLEEENSISCKFPQLWVDWLDFWRSMFEYLVSPENLWFRSTTKW